MADRGGHNYMDLVANARAAAAAPAVEMFKGYNVAYTCQDAVSKLRQVQRTSNTEGWSEVEVCTVTEKGSLKPKLKCRLCSTHCCCGHQAVIIPRHQLRYRAQLVCVGQALHQKYQPAPA